MLGLLCWTRRLECVGMSESYVHDARVSNQLEKAGSEAKTSSHGTPSLPSRTRRSAWTDITDLDPALTWVLVLAGHAADHVAVHEAARALQAGSVVSSLTLAPDPGLASDLLLPCPSFFNVERRRGALPRATHLTYNQLTNVFIFPGPFARRFRLACRATRNHAP